MVNVGKEKGKKTRESVSVQSNGRTNTVLHTKRYQLIHQHIFLPIHISIENGRNGRTSNIAG